MLSGLSQSDVHAESIVATTPSDVSLPQNGVPAGLYPDDTRTGVAAIDAVIAAVLNGDADGLESLVRLSSVACTTESGLGGPPKCANGEADGTVVQALPVDRCGEGSVERADSGLATVYGSFVADGVWLSSAWNVGSEDGFQLFADANVTGVSRVMFAASTSDTGRRVATLDASGRVVGLSFGCATPAETYQGAAGFILPPPNSDVTPVAPATGSGLEASPSATHIGDGFVGIGLAGAVVLLILGGVVYGRRRV